VRLHRSLRAPLLTAFALLVGACSDDNQSPPGASPGGAGGGGIPSGGSTSSAGGGAGGAGSPARGGAGAGGTSASGGASAGQAGGGVAGGGAPTGGAGSGSLGGGGAGGAGGSGGAAGGTGGSGGSGGAAGYRPCPATGSCKIMPFGDSITQGFNVAGGYRAPLFQRAHADGHDITFVGSANDYSVAMVDGVTFPRNHEGHGGYTIEDNAGRNAKGIAQFVPTSMKNYAPHIVTLMIGTNDINGNIDVANAPKRLGALLDALHTANPDVLVVLAQIVPTANDGTNQAVRTYNAAMPALVSERTGKGHHLVLVDMYTAFTSHADYKTSLMGDNLHPNQAGYKLLGDTWYAALTPFL